MNHFHLHWNSEADVHSTATNKFPKHSSRLHESLREEIEALPHKIRQGVYNVLDHPQYPKWMSAGRKLSLNPVWINKDEECIELVNKYPLDRESTVQIKRIDMFLIKCNDKNEHGYLRTYFSKKWKTYLIPHNPWNEKYPEKRADLNAKLLAKYWKVEDGSIVVSPLEGKYLVSIKKNLEHKDLLIYIFEFCSVMFTQIPNIKDLAKRNKAELAKWKEDKKKRAWLDIDDLRDDEIIMSVNGDVVRAVYDWFHIHLELLPESLPNEFLKI
jgi:hypothetical protein